MFKKFTLCLLLVIALVVGPIGGGVFAMENNQQCTLIAGSKILQILPDQSLRGVITPQDDTISIGAQITAEMAENLTRQVGFNWTGAHIAMIEVDFGTGPMPLMLVVRPENVKDCK